MAICLYSLLPTGGEQGGTGRDAEEKMLDGRPGSSGSGFDLNLDQTLYFICKYFCNFSAFCQLHFSEVWKLLLSVVSHVLGEKVFGDTIGPS